MQRSFEIPRAAVRGGCRISQQSRRLWAFSRVLLPAGEALSLGAKISMFYSARGGLAGPAVRFEQEAEGVGAAFFVEASSGFIRDGSRRFRGVDFLGAPGAA